jgi:hypothetical protein
MEVTENMHARYAAAFSRLSALKSTQPNMTIRNVMGIVTHFGSLFERLSHHSLSIDRKSP